MSQVPPFRSDEAHSFVQSDERCDGVGPRNSLAMGKADGRPAGPAGHGPMRAAVPEWVHGLVDRIISQGCTGSGASVAALAKEAFTQCAHVVARSGEADVPYHILSQMIRRRRHLHFGKDRPLGEVTIHQAVVSVRPSGSKKTRIHLTLARDTDSGRTVGLAAGVEPHDADDVLALFGNPPDERGPPPSSIVRRCGALPDVLVIDHGLCLEARHRIWFASHGVCLRFQSAGASGAFGMSRDDGRRLAEIRAAVGRGIDPMDALGDWLKHHDAGHRRGGDEAPADRSRAAIARHALRRTARAVHRSS
jgi:hypothetical protein